MRLTAYTNYALRTLMFCALHPGQLVRMEDVSDAYGISRAHLLKAARQLGQLGYLENVRGRSGGVRLGRTPDEIVIGEVVRHTEGDLELVECILVVAEADVHRPLDQRSQHGEIWRP